jgi:hypothetical protein
MCSGGYEVAERVAGPDFVAASKPFLQEQNSIMTGRVAGPQADKFRRLAIVPAADCVTKGMNLVL